jgi:uncharacterized protein YbjT (DUF2867 family)
LGSPDAKFQPVWVEDVARAFVTSLDQPATFGKTYTLAGPDVFTMRELLALVCALTRQRPWVIGLGAALSNLQAMVFEFPPGKWIAAALGVVLTRDNVASMQVPNVSDEAFPAIFGQAQSLAAIAPTYLATDAPHAAGRAQYDRFRAGR